MDYELLPGKHFLTILKLYRFNLFRDSKEIPSSHVSDSSKKHEVEKKRSLEDAEMFLQVLSAAKIDWTVTKVIVTDLNPKTYHSIFLKSLQEVLNSTKSQFLFKNRIFVVDLKRVDQKRILLFAGRSFDEGGKL